MTDSEAQEDEILALKSIYSDERILTCVDQGGKRGGMYSAHLEVPKPFILLYCDNLKAAEAHAGTKPKQKEVAVQHMPPLVLNFELPENYPSEQPPSFTLSSKWLTRLELSKLCKRLDEIWDENEGEVILFLWMNFLQEEVITFLKISSPRDLSKVVKPRSKSITEELKTGDIDQRAFQDVASQDLLVPAILQHDTEEKERIFKQTMFKCCVCFEDRLGSQCTKFVCDHVYCQDCMRDYFVTLINEGSVNQLGCPTEKCESSATPAQVKGLVSEEQFARYDRLLLQTTLDTMHDVMYCPRTACGCPVLVDEEGGMGSCPSCLFHFCIYCKLTYHGINPCSVGAKEALRLREEYIEGTDEEKILLEKRYGKKTIQRLVEESFSQEWLENCSRKCPSCKVAIQKIDGCNKMKCGNCGCSFCWLCGDRLNLTNPYSHFSLQGAKCFNKLFNVNHDVRQGNIENGAFVEEEGFVQDPDFWEDELDLI